MVKALILFMLFPLTVSGIGIYRAIWLFWPISVTLLPNRFVYVPIGGHRIHIDMLIYLAAVPMLILSPGRPSGGRLRLLDLVVLLLALTDVISTTINQGLYLFEMTYTPLRNYLPYLIGRMYLRSEDDLYPVLSAMSRVLGVVAVLALLETFTRTGIIVSLVIGGRYSTEIRYGLMRACLGYFGPLPLGDTVLMLMPWTLEAARWGRDGSGPRWWRHAPKFAFLTLLATLSRGPVLAGFVVLAGDLFFRKPQLRVPLVVGALLMGGLLYTNKDFFVSLMDQIQGTEGEVVNTIYINGQPRLYSSASHRILLYEVYADAMKQAGAFGFDREWVQFTRPELPMFRSIDNQYISLRLTRGYVGLLLYDLLLAWTIFRAGRYALNHHNLLAGLAGGMCTSIAAMALVLFTVPLVHQTAGVILWTAGIVASLPGLRSREPSDDGWHDEEVDEHVPDGAEGPPAEEAQAGWPGRPEAR